MKILLLFFCITLFTLLGQSKTIYFYDGLFSNPLMDVRISIKQSATSDSVIFESGNKNKINIDLKKHHNSIITISHPTGHYKNRLFIIDESFNPELPIYLYATKEYELSFTEMTPIESKNLTQENTTTFIDDGPCFDNKGETLVSFIGRIMVYPIELIQNDIEGFAHIKFIVERNGNPTHLTVIKSSGPEILVDEAKRIIRKTHWIPTKINGESVRDYMNLPFSFKLE